MASKAIGFLNFKFAADLTAFDRAMKKASKKLKKFGKSVAKAGKSLTVGLTLPILALGAASIKAFDEQAKAETKLLTALKGREDIQKRLIEQAKELQKTTLYGDEATIESQALLASLGLTEEQIVMLMPQIQNMATALGMDLTAATSLVSKSVSTTTDALARYFDTGLKGVTGQQERAVVLTEALTDKFDGQAEAAALVGAGPLIQMKNQLGDLGEELGKKLMPFVKQFVDWAIKMIQKLDGMSNATKDSIVKWGLILAAIGPVLVIIGKLSIGIGALIPLVGKLGKMIVANPWLLAAAAIVIAAKAIYDYTTAVDGAEKASQSLFDLNVNAQVQAKEEERLLKSNLAIARDKTLSDNSRKKAITVLNNKLVGLNETLNLQNIAEVNVTNAIDKHTAAMMHQAKVAGTQELITETFKELTKATFDMGAAWDDMDFFQQFAEADRAIKAQIFGLKSFDEVTKEHGKERSKKYIEALTEELAKYEDVAKELTLNAPEGFEEYMAKLASAGNLMSDNITPTEDLAAATVEYSRELDPIIKGMEEYAKKFPLVTAGASKFSVELFRLIEAQKQFNATLDLFEDIMFSAAMNAANSQESFFSSFMENLKDAIKQLLIQLAVITAIKFLIGGPGVAGDIATAFSMAKADVLGLKEGGIVTGPTTALIGEYPGAASNPEVVAPLDKLKSMMGTGNQNIIVEGRLVGNDIYLSNERTKFNRNRTV